jgi:membrane protein insertase Oxa1/YidC/SpoIIIJ
MPVFIIMYQLLRGLTLRPGGLGSGAGQIVAQTQLGDATTPWIFTNQLFTPAHLNPDTTLYKALSCHERHELLRHGPVAVRRPGHGQGRAHRTPLLCCSWLIMLATGLYQNRQLQARNTSGNVNPQQQMIMKFMPFFLPIFSYGFPAGLALYWCTQNFCRIGTNAYITRSVYRKEHAEDEAIEVSGSEKAGPDQEGQGAASGLLVEERRIPKNGSRHQVEVRRRSGEAVDARQERQEPGSASSKVIGTRARREGPRPSSAKKAPVNATPLRREAVVVPRHRRTSDTSWNGSRPPPETVEEAKELALDQLGVARERSRVRVGRGAQERALRTHSWIGEGPCACSAADAATEDGAQAPQQEAVGPQRERRCGYRGDGAGIRARHRVRAGRAVGGVRWASPQQRCGILSRCCR